jgi:hypothetical protein
MISERDSQGVSTGNIYWGVGERLIQREAFSAQKHNRLDE